MIPITSNNMHGVPRAACRAPADAMNRRVRAPLSPGPSLSLTV